MDEKRAAERFVGDGLGADLCGGQTVGMKSGLHQRLYERKRILLHQLSEVDTALKALNEDATVQKVLMILEVSGK